MIINTVIYCCVLLDKTNKQAQKEMQNLTGKCSIEAIFVRLKFCESVKIRCEPYKLFVFVYNFLKCKILEEYYQEAPDITYTVNVCHCIVRSQIFYWSRRILCVGKS